MYQLLPNGDVRRLSDNAMIPNDSGNRDWVEYRAWCEAGNSALPPPSAPPEAPYDPISWLDFMGLFTPAEQAAIAVSDNPTVAVFRMMATGLGGDMNMADPRVSLGLDALVAAGLIASSRKADVLSRRSPN